MLHIKYITIFDSQKQKDMKDKQTVFVSNKYDYSHTYTPNLGVVSMVLSYI